MSFDDWIGDLIVELMAVFDMTREESEDYIDNSGEDVWREAYEVGLTPKETAAEQAWSAMYAL